jgi:hypothetical protein
MIEQGSIWKGRSRRKGKFTNNLQISCIYKYQLLLIAIKFIVLKEKLRKKQIKIYSLLKN